MTLVIENKEDKDLKTTLHMIRTASSKKHLKPFKFTKTDIPTDEEMETMETKKCQDIPLYCAIPTFTQIFPLTSY